MTEWHVPHDQLTPGLWYLHTDTPPFYTVVSLTRFAIGPDEGKLGVWMIDEEGNHWPEDFGDDQFIGPVRSPPFPFDAAEKQAQWELTRSETQPSPHSQA